MISKRNRSILLLIGSFLFAPIVLLESKMDPMYKQYEPSGTNTHKAASQLPIEFALGAITGFREAIAGLLWVRTDEFFHDGDYEAITPMIRIITWLDPHQTDVYQTGAWHMDYNFTDVNQRSDRRYIPLSLALMREGIDNNDNVPDMYGDLAFTHYFRKIGDYPMASLWFKKGQDMVAGVNQRAAAQPNDAELQQETKDDAMSVIGLGHTLAHSLEAEGRIPEAIKQWQYVIATHENNIAKGLGVDHGERSSLVVAQKQLVEIQERAKWRARDTKVPLNVHFSALLERVAPKVFWVRGTMTMIGAVPNSFNFQTGQVKWAPQDGCRIEVRLQDQGYKMPVIPSFSLSSLNLDPNVTIMQDSASCRNGRFDRKIDMSQDPTMYSFTAPKYTVTLWFDPSDPSDCPPNVQDRIGWLGEALTDARYLDTSGIVSGDTSTRIPGLHQIKKTFTLTREDILGTGEKTFN